MNPGKYALAEACRRVVYAHRPDGPLPPRKGDDQVNPLVGAGHTASEIREQHIGRALAFEPTEPPAGAGLPAVHLHELSRADA
jgi:hypothetical protein